ncbi:MAG: AAA family ATPase [Gallionella sp.]|nr:AAA family ATPase [Gallionella sp.]
MDKISVLRAMSGKRLTKLWKADGTIDGYDDTKNYQVTEIEVSSIRHFAEHFFKLNSMHSSCIIRGTKAAQAIESSEYPGHYRRTNDNFHDQPLHLVMLDIDKYQVSGGIDPVQNPVEAIEQYINAVLPAFRNVSYCWQLSGSAGLPKYKGILKAHIWFWLSTPRTSFEMKQWAKATSPLIDASLFQQVQIHYTAAPIFDAGVADPVTVRVGVFEGLTDEVDLTMPSNFINPATGEIINRKESNDDLIAKITSGENYHDSLLTLTARLAWQDVSKDAMLEQITGFMDSVAIKDDRWQERMNAIPGMIDSADKYRPASPGDIFGKSDVLPAALSDLLHRPVMRYKLLTDDELAALPPLQWRIKKVLPQTGLAAVFGASGSGKSFAVLDMLQCVAAGRDWFGYKTKPCNVLYCALEGEGGIAGRVAAYRIRHGVTSQNIRYLVKPFSLLDEADIHDLAQAIHANGQCAEVVVLDTLNRAAPGADENDSKSMGQIIAASKELQTLVGGLVVLVHHTGKDASRGLRGHSSLHAALDAEIEVRRDGDRREWVIAKSKDGEDGEAHPFKLDIVELGIDQDGEPITSCTVHPLEDIADSIKKVMPPKSGHQRAVWDALGEIFRKAGSVKPEGAPDTLPPGRPCITLEAAIDKTRARLVCDPKRQTERAQAAIRGLVGRGLLCHEGGFVWCK